MAKYCQFILAKIRDARLAKDYQKHQDIIINKIDKTYKFDKLMLAIDSIDIVKEIMIGPGSGVPISIGGYPSNIYIYIYI